MKKPKILIISQGVWDDSSSFGNTFTNFFKDWDNDKIAHVYTDAYSPNTKCCGNFFNISEKAVIKSIFKRKIQTGFKVETSRTGDGFNEFSKTQINRIAYIKSNCRFQLLIWLRELCWFLGKWKSNDLEEFIDSFQPDIIFLAFNTNFYINRIQRYVIQYCKKPVVMYTADDGYTLKQFSMSIWFWLDRIIKRPIIRRTIKMVDILYVISKKQLKEYNKIFDNKCRMLYKWSDFSKEETYKFLPNKIIKLVYTGNINLGRWKSLVQIGRTLDDLNLNKKIAELDLYSHTQCTSEIMNSFKSISSINFKGSVPSQEIPEIQKKADILIHCEALTLKERLKVRLSFSTKIVDYFSRKRCIFAVGNKKCASISYLIENDSAVVATSQKEVKEKLKWILCDKRRIKEYAEKAWSCGKKNHNSDIIQKKFYEDLYSLAKGKNNENLTN